MQKLATAAARPRQKLLKRAKKLVGFWQSHQYLSFVFYFFGCWPLFVLCCSTAMFMFRAAFCLASPAAWPAAAASASFVAAQVGGKAVNRRLKAMFMHQRPDGSGKAEEGKGMPSYHAQAGYFAAVYLADGSMLPWGSPWIMLLHSCAFAVSASRLYLQMHTVAQVAVGAAVGTALAQLLLLLLHAIGITE